MAGFSTLLLAALGLLVGQAIAEATQTPPAMVIVASVVVLGILGLILARLWWAMILGALLAATALAIVILKLRLIAPAVQGNVPLPPLDWLKNLADAIRQWHELLWREHRLPELLATVPLLLLALVLGLVRPASTRIFTASVLGAAAIIGGACIMANHARPGTLVFTGWHGWAILGTGVVLAFAGMAFQSRAEFRSKQKSDKEVEAAPPPKPPMRPR